MKLSLLDTAEALAQPAPRAILQFLQNDPQAHRVRRIREALGLTAQEFALALRVLERHRMVERKTPQMPGDPPSQRNQHLYIELTEEARQRRE